MKATHRRERFATLELNEEQRNWLLAELNIHRREPKASSDIRREFINALTPPETCNDETK